MAYDSRLEILREQFIPDNVCIYVAQGGFRVFDGNKNYVFEAGNCCIARKNRLAKYELIGSIEDFRPIIFCFDEAFLRTFLDKHPLEKEPTPVDDSFITIRKSELIESFILSIKPYYKEAMRLDEAFEALKYEELLIILLKTQPELAAILFDFRKPGKIDLENFMNRNFRFNVNISQFAFLTGRSLSAFKRDFKTIFNESPNRWLVKRRLQEAFVLLHKKHQKPSDIYIDLGFESLSHFSTAFKKAYGKSPTEVNGEKKAN